MKTIWMTMSCAAVAMFAASCARVTVDPIEVKPIYITMDVNIKVDRQLDNFFAFEDKYQPTTQPASTQPAAATTASKDSAAVSKAGE